QSLKHGLPLALIHAAIAAIQTDFVSGHIECVGNLIEAPRYIRFPRYNLNRALPQPRRAASIAAISIFFMCIIASNARLAAAVSGSVTAFVRAIGVICQDNPHLSLHQPHALSWPPLPSIAFQ